MDREKTLSELKALRPGAAGVTMQMFRIVEGADEPETIEVRGDQMAAREAEGWRLVDPEIG